MDFLGKFEGVLQMIHRGPAILPFDGDDIKTDPTAGGPPTCEVLHRHPGDAFLFTHVDRFERRTEAGCGAPADLDERNGVSARDHEIDLSRARPEIPLEQNVTRAAQMIPGRVLAGTAEVPPGHDGDALLASSSETSGSAEINASISRSSASAGRSRPEKRASS